MNIVKLNPSSTSTGDDDKPPFFLPNRAAYRRVADPAKSRLRKARKWAHRTDGTPVGELFTALAEGAERDLVALQGARA